jgi:hypothetical protein
VFGQAGSQNSHCRGIETKLHDTDGQTKKPLDVFVGIFVRPLSPMLVQLICQLATCEV